MNEDGFLAPPPPPEDFGTLRHELAERREQQGGHRPPRGPKGPRFGLLRRIVRLIRGGGD